MNVVVKAPNRSISFKSSDGERILYSALSRGIDLPHECISGTCGSCRARLTHGSVEQLWMDAPALSLIKPEEYLLCQCAAVGDCEFEVKHDLEESSCDNLPNYYRGVIGNWQRLLPDVVEFTVNIGKEMAFKAGQFVALSFPGVEGGRCYSMVNSDSPSRSLHFVIKRKSGGTVSQWMFDADRAGEEIGCFGPVGRAIYDPAVQHDILCVAGGSGIAGMMSILARAAESRHFDRYKGHVFFGLRSAKDCFFLKELSEFVNAFPDSLYVTVALSEEFPPERLQTYYPALAFDRGMVHEVACKKLASPLVNVSAFVAGPPAAVSATLRILLVQLKLAPMSIKYDKFG